MDKEINRVNDELNTFLEEGIVVTIGPSELNEQSDWYPTVVKFRDLNRIRELLETDHSLEIVINAMKLKINELVEVEDYHRAAFLQEWIKRIEHIEEKLLHD